MTTGLEGIMAEAIRYIFNEGKAAEAASYLLFLNGGTLDSMKLIRLLYIADRRSLSQFHSSITTDSYYSLKLGPVPSAILDCIKHPEDYPADSPWNSLMETCKSDHTVRQKKSFAPFYLSEEEMAILWDVDKSCGNNDIPELANQFPEWKDPRGSRIPLYIEDILEAAIADEAERKIAADDIRLSAHLHGIAL